MVKSLFFLLSVLLTSSSFVQAKNLGVFGHTFEIHEEDFLEVLQARIRTLASQGKLQEYQEEVIKRTKKSMAQPKPVKGLQLTTLERTFYYNPNLTVPYDIKDHTGRCIHKAGTKVNPLAIKPFRKTLVFIDGDNERQVKFALKLHKGNRLLKIILVKGAPFDLMNSYKTPLYFDQEGVLIQKLGIKQVPAIVSQEGILLKIEEVNLDKRQL